MSDSFATGSVDGVVIIWDIASGTAKLTLKPHKTSGVRGLGFSNDGAFLVTGGDDAKVVITQTDTGNQLKVLSGHNGGIKACIFSPVSYVVYSIDRVEMRCWNPFLNPELLQILKTGTNSEIALSCDPKGRYVAFNIGKRLDVYETRDLSKFQYSYLKASAQIRSIAFSPDSKLIASTSNNGSLLIRNVKTGSNLICCYPSQKAVRKMILNIQIDRNGEKKK